MLGQERRIVQVLSIAMIQTTEHAKG